MTPSNKWIKYTAYLSEEMYKELMKFSVKNDIPATKIIRDGIANRLNKGDPYVGGYNAGVEKAMIVVKKNKAAGMRFPDGKSVSDMLCDDLKKNLMENKK